MIAGKIKSLLMKVHTHKHTLTHKNTRHTNIHTGFKVAAKSCVVNRQIVILSPSFYQSKDRENSSKEFITNQDVDVTWSVHISSLSYQNHH